ncbi:helix-turn-helix domain-containing protein [Rhizobium straminoryzae]|nr:helix-turn-helix domain-containing protein [Rhizobium straminoryzae]
MKHSRTSNAASSPFPSSPLHIQPASEDDPWAFWAHALAPLAVAALRPSPDGTDTAFLTAHHAGLFLLLHSHLPALALQRSRLRCTEDGLDHLVITCLLSGRARWRSDRLARLEPGDCGFCDLASPLALRTTGGTQALHFIIPRLALPASVAPLVPIRERRFAAGSSPALLLQGLAATLLRALAAPAPMELSAFSRPLMDLMALILGPAGKDAGTAAHADLRRRLRRHIQDNLASDGMTADSICADLRLSRSQLYRQFEGEGGVETYIRRRRLARSLQMLSDPACAERRIGEIAYEAGFADEAHFSRLFRQHYGLSPRAFRKSGSVAPALPIGSGNSQDASATFARWLRQL